MQHTLSKDFKPCRVFCDGEDISHIAFCWDEEAGIAYCYVPLNEVKPDRSPNGRAMASSLDSSLAWSVGGDAFLVRQFQGKIEVGEL